MFVLSPSEGRSVAKDDDIFKMQMFVAVSRARERVYLIEKSTLHADDPVTRLLPDDKVLARGPKHDADRNVIDATRRPETSQRVPNGHNVARSPAATKDDAFDIATKFAASKSLKTLDNRSVGGAFWIFGGNECRPHLEPHGFKYNDKRKGWWKS